MPHIIELEKKVDAMIDVMARLGRIADRNFTTFCQALGVKHTTLKSAIKRSDSLSDELERQLAERVDFCLTHSSWRRPFGLNGRGRHGHSSAPDSAARFRAYLLNRHLGQTIDLVLMPQHTASYYGGNGVEMMGGQGAPIGKAVPVHVEWRVDGRTELDGIAWGLGQVILRLRPESITKNPADEGDLTVTALKTGSITSRSLGNSTITQAFGQARPEWEQTATSGYLEGVYRLDAPLAEVTVSGDNARLVAELLVDKNRLIVEPEPDHKGNPNRTAARKALLAMLISNGDAGDGRLILADQAAVVDERLRGGL